MNRQNVPTSRRPLFSICVPAFNRAEYLPALLDSILLQDLHDAELLIIEDASPQRTAIADIIQRYTPVFPCPVRYEENQENLGYDANIRSLVQAARGKYCLFMGNDDVMAAGAVAHAAALIERWPNAGMILKAYTWFDRVPDHPADTVRYSAVERQLEAGQQALAVCYRRSGIISGFIIDRDLSSAASTDRYDGTLYYQLHLCAAVLATRPAVVTPRVMVHCRASTPPDFGSASSETATFQPGQYTPAARYAMVSGAMRILADHGISIGPHAVRQITRDYASHFYPFIRDQLRLPFPKYLALYRKMAGLGFWRFPSFHLNFIVPYIFGKTMTDRLIKQARSCIGNTPIFARPHP